MNDNLSKILLILELYNLKFGSSGLGRFVEKISESGNVNVTNFEGDSIFSYLIKNNFYDERTTELTNYLINEGLTVKLEDFIQATLKGYVDIIFLFLSKNLFLDEQILEFDDENFDGAQFFGRNALCFAVQGGHIEIIQLLINAGSNINLQDGKGRTALYFAINTNQIEALRMLIENGASVNLLDLGGKTPLILASDLGRGDIVSLLLSNNARVNTKDLSGNTAIDYSIQKGHANIVSLLILNGAELNIGHLFCAYEGRYISIVQMLLDNQISIDGINEIGETLLINSCCDGEEYFAHMFLKNGANPNLQNNLGNSALHLATKNGHTKIVKELISFGVELDLINKEREVTYETENIIGCIDGNNIFEYSYRNEGKDSPLLIATKKNHLGIVKLLVQKGANLNLQDSYGNTALMIAVENGNFDIFKFLLIAGADFKIENRLGMSVIDLAISKKYTGIVNELIKSGVKIDIDKAFDLGMSLLEDVNVANNKEMKGQIDVPF